MRASVIPKTIVEIRKKMREKMGGGGEQGRASSSYRGCSARKAE